MNIFDDVNQWIFDFVHEPTNRRLRAGTGAYSTPFRGDLLLGEKSSAAVAGALMARRVDVLWLGANPNVPRSLSLILDESCGDGDFPAFQKQKDSEFFSSRRWSAAGVASPDWNPIEMPRGGWKVYREVLGRVASLDAIAMSNFIPWGSTTTNQFVSAINSADPALLRRVLEFADLVNTAIIDRLRPKLLVVPLSLGRNEVLDNIRTINVAMKSASEVQLHTIETGAAPFTFYTAVCRVGGHLVPTVYLRHPSALRLRSEAKPRVVEGVARELVPYTLPT